MRRLTLALNLATEPFRHDRPVVVLSIVLSAALGALLAMQWVALAAERGQTAHLRQAISETERALREMASREAELKRRLANRETQGLLRENELLAGLIRRKAISWTRLFADLEQVVPHDVKLVQIRPQLSANEQILVEMVVAARSAEAVIELLRVLERSRWFRQAQLLASFPPSETEPLLRCRVSVQYVPAQQ